MAVRVQAEPFDVGQELARLTAGNTGIGGVASFTGLVRDEGGRLSGLEIEHYPGMTESALADYGARAAARFGLSDWRIVHRHGRLAVGEPIMMVATAARHRKAAFDAQGRFEGPQDQPG